METTIEKNWHVDTSESVFEANAETIEQWIREGAVLSHHRISRDGLRWLEAGKIPRFSPHFAAVQQITDVLTGEETEVGVAPPGGEERSPLPSAAANIAPSFGLRLLAGSMVAFFVALLGGYLWAYQFSTAKDIDLIIASPGVQALQFQYDTEKTILEEKKSAVESARKAAMAPPPAALSDHSYEFVDCDRNEPGTVEDCADWRKQVRQWNETQRKAQAAATPYTIMPPVMTDPDRKLLNLDAKLQADKKQVIADKRREDTRSKFYKAFALLFLGLVGLHLARLSFSSKK